MNSPSPIDELLSLALAGDPDAYGRVVAREGRALWRCARALCGDDHLADDLVQETFVAAWNSRERYDGRCRFSTWLYGILRFRHLKARRSQRGGIATGERAFPDEVMADQRADLSTAANPPDEAVRVEEGERLREAVAALSPEQRSVVELRFFAGASLEDVATLLDIPLGTVKSRLHNGLVRLRVAHRRSPDA